MGNSEASSHSAGAYASANSYNNVVEDNDAQNCYREGQPMEAGVEPEDGMRLSAAIDMQETSKSNRYSPSGDEELGGGIPSDHYGSDASDCSEIEE